MSLRTRQLANDFGFTFAIRLAVGMKNFVEPHWWWLKYVWFFPRIPGQIGLGFAGYQSPIDRGNMVLLGDGKNCVERAAYGARHEFGAQDRTMIRLQRAHVFFEVLGPTVVVERNHIRLFELNARDWVQFIRR